MEDEDVRTPLVMIDTSSTIPSGVLTSVSDDSWPTQSGRAKSIKRLRLGKVSQKPEPVKTLSCQCGAVGHKMTKRDYRL